MSCLAGMFLSCLALTFESAGAANEPHYITNLIEISENLLCKILTPLSIRKLYIQGKFSFGKTLVELELLLSEFLIGGKLLVLNFLCRLC